MIKIKIYLRKIKSFIVNLFETTSVHGLRHLVTSGIHLAERVVWLIFISLAFYGTALLARRIWVRYQTSPVVMSMDRNMFFWNTSFPSVTVCNHKRIEPKLVDIYMR